MIKDIARNVLEIIELPQTSCLASMMPAHALPPRSSTHKDIVLTVPRHIEQAPIN